MKESHPLFRYDNATQWAIITYFFYNEALTQGDIVQLRSHETAAWPVYEAKRAHFKIV